MLKFRRQSSSQHHEDNTTMQDVRDRAQEILQDIGDSFSMNMSRDDMKSPRFWSAVLGELLGTMILVLFGCGAWIETDVEEHPLTVRVAMTFGLVYAVVLYSLRPVSGGHINPTITIAMVVTRQISLARAGFYCLAQILGGIIGAALLLGFTPVPYRDFLGCTHIARELSAGQGFGIELLTSFFYVFVVFSCYAKVDKVELVVYNLFTPFVIGFTAIAIHLFAIPFTGASLNPARSFGPSVVTGNWNDHWIYWFGPIIGGTLGGVIQQTAFGRKASLNHLKACMMTHETDGSNDKLATITTMSSLSQKPQQQSEVKRNNSNKYVGSSVVSSVKRKGSKMEEISSDTQSQSSSASSFKKSSRPPGLRHNASFRSNKISDSSSLAMSFSQDAKAAGNSPKTLSYVPETIIQSDRISGSSLPLLATPIQRDTIDETNGSLASTSTGPQDKKETSLQRQQSQPEDNHQKKIKPIQNGPLRGFAHAGVQAGNGSRKDIDGTNTGVQTSARDKNEMRDTDANGDITFTQTSARSKIETKEFDATSDLTTVTPLPSHMASFEDDGSVLSVSSGGDQDTEDTVRTWHEQSSADGATNRLYRSPEEEFTTEEENPDEFHPEEEKDGSPV